MTTARESVGDARDGAASFRRGQANRTPEEALRRRPRKGLSCRKLGLYSFTPTPNLYSRSSWRFKAWRWRPIAPPLVSRRGTYLSVRLSRRTSSSQTRSCLMVHGRSCWQWLGIFKVLRRSLSYREPKIPGSIWTLWNAAPLISYFRRSPLLTWGISFVVLRASGRRRRSGQLRVRTIDDWKTGVACVFSSYRRSAIPRRSSSFGHTLL